MNGSTLWFICDSMALILNHLILFFAHFTIYRVCYGAFEITILGNLVLVITFCPSGASNRLFRYNPVIIIPASCVTSSPSVIALTIYDTQDLVFHGKVFPQPAPSRWEMTDKANIFQYFPKYWLRQGPSVGFIILLVLNSLYTLESLFQRNHKPYAYNPSHF